MTDYRLPHRIDNDCDMLSYDRVLVAFSGGKDSLACLLAVIAAGVPAERIELWHHDVDGAADSFMDWPVTLDYCRRVAAHFKLPLYLSYKEGGFLREMNRDQSATAPIVFETPDGVERVGGAGPLNTRNRFPQVAADLKVRWCSAYLKIDVMAAAIRNQDRFLGIRTLVVTGERAEESTSRARYKTFEPHRSDTRNGTKRARHVDTVRLVHSWSEKAVWDIIAAYGIVPHLSYQLGWGRLSCLSCIFGSPDQWATIRAVFPEWFERIADREATSGLTIQRSGSIRDLADKGTPFAAAVARPDLCAAAMRHQWDSAIAVAPEDWTLPAGAFGDSAGPV